MDFQNCAITNHFSQGGEGASELAEAVAEATEEKTSFSVLYPDEMDIKEKIKTVPHFFFCSKETIMGTLK